MRAAASVTALSNDDQNETDSNPGSAVRGDTSAWMWGLIWGNAVEAFVARVSTGALMVQALVAGCLAWSGGVDLGDPGWWGDATGPKKALSGGVGWGGLDTVPALPVRVTAWIRPSSVAMRAQGVPQGRSATRMRSRASQHNSGVRGREEVFAVEAFLGSDGSPVDAEPAGGSLTQVATQAGWSRRAHSARR